MTAVSSSSHQSGGKWRDVLIEMLRGIRAAVVRFPVVVLFLVAACIWANILIAYPEISVGALEAYDSRLVLGLLTGAVAALAVTLFFERRAVPLAGRQGAALLIGLAVTAPFVMSQAFALSPPALIAGVAGSALVAPFLWRGDSASFWMFGARAAFAALLAVLALVLFAGGISAILASLTHLFGLEVPDRLYHHVWVFTGLFAAPLFGLGQLPEGFDEGPALAQTGFMDRGMRSLGDFVAAPLLIVYAVILHLYALKIVVTGEVPDGQIGWLVLSYGFCVFFVLLLISPFFDRARAPSRLFLRWWPALLPLPLVLLFYALALRVNGFGLTPERYFLGLFAVVTLVVLLLQLLPRSRGDIRIMATLPALAFVLGSFGPQGAVGTSITSQTARFQSLVAGQAADMASQDEALGALRFLDRHDALPPLPDGSEAEAAPDERESRYRAVAKAWGLDPDRPVGSSSAYVLRDVQGPVAFGIAGYDVVVHNVMLSAGSKTPLETTLPDGDTLTFALDGDALVISGAGENVRFPILPDQLRKLADTGGDGQNELDLTTGGRTIRIVPTHFYADNADDPRLQSMQTTILLNSADWR
ncbi:DUF4153 domain-containing protein [Nitratireductor luteus]|uniref:DUF4153 domain-containing protein n=1 Tax=Nitratireductor luteus TaxID=2976980 RepID=UPI00223ED96C|nr:DUF4153 domain-containing protein [Nitratireductor luteus]